MSYPNKTSDNPCLNCNSYFIIKRKRDEKQKFCGRKCASTFLKSNKETRNCLTCNKQFLTIPSHDYYYCSRSCANKSRAVVHIRNCERCSNEFILDNIAYERRGDGRFCSRECATRIYEFDEYYFENIDTPEKAYWLGMLLSDGNLYKTQMTLKLQRKDRILLEKFKLALNSQHPIHDGISADGHEFSSFFIGSKKLAKQLENIGVVPNKTFIVEFPNIKKKLIPHFIRGYFDGDGCMYLHKQYHTWSIYSASPKFINNLLKTMTKETGLHFNSYKNSISLSRGAEIILLEKYLYNNANIFLERKRDKIVQAISYINHS